MRVVKGYAQDLDLVKKLYYSELLFLCRKLEGIEHLKVLNKYVHTRPLKHEIH